MQRKLVLQSLQFVKWGQLKQKKMLSYLACRKAPSP
jgi:hypothetical protein